MRGKVLTATNRQADWRTLNRKVTVGLEGGAARWLILITLLNFDKATRSTAGKDPYSINGSLSVWNKRYLNNHFLLGLGRRQTCTGSEGENLTMQSGLQRSYWSFCLWCLCDMTPCVLQETRLSTCRVGGEGNNKACMYTWDVNMLLKQWVGDV